MTTFPNSPKLLKDGSELIDTVTSEAKRIIALRVNPDSISHTLQVQGVGGSGIQLTGNNPAQPGLKIGQSVYGEIGHA